MVNEGVEIVERKAFRREIDWRSAIPLIVHLYVAGKSPPPEAMTAVKVASLVQEP